MHEIKNKTNWSKNVQWEWNKSIRGDWFDDNDKYSSSNDDTIANRIL